MNLRNNTSVCLKNFDAGTELASGLWVTNAQTPLAGRRRIFQALFVLANPTLSVQLRASQIFLHLCVLHVMNSICVFVRGRCCGSICEYLELVFVSHSVDTWTILLTIKGKHQE